MLALATTIIARLASLPELAGWDIRSSTELVDRRPLPAIDVRWEGAVVPDPARLSVLLTPQWTITLIVRRAAGAAAQIDTAFEAIFRALHGWAPPPAPGSDRGWGLMQMRRASAPIFADEGHAGMTLDFTTTALFNSGQIAR